MNYCIANNGFGELPKQRGSGSLLAIAISLLIYIAVVFSYRSNTNSPQLWFVEDIGMICAVVSSILLGEFLRSLILLGEEKNHLSSRYSHSLFKAFLACIPVSMGYYGIFKLVVFLITTIVTLLYWKLSDNTNFTWCTYATVMFINAINRAILSKAEISNLNETENKHVADGLAWSFYFGYLKLMLPCLDGMISNAVKGDGFAIDDCDLRDKLSSEKVFIVIPKNCFTYDSFTDTDSRITFATSMPPKRQNRGGVQQRVYKNTVWKIQLTENEAPLYVLMEYATPCLSMYDMQNMRNCKFSEEDLENQVKEFSSKLKTILDADPKCVGKYELVLCGDIKKQKLGDVISDAVRHQGRLNIEN